jgi:BioD-like phosphotransacetylase family protein
MATLYITSAETFSGKSALCIGLGIRFRDDGLKVGYMKPVNISCQLLEGLAYDEDIAFARQVFEMPEPPELIGPVALTPARMEQQLRGPEVDYEPRLVDAFARVSAGRDVMILEGGRSLREGYIVGLPPKRVAELLDARILTVLRYDETLMVDRALTAQNYFGSLMMGMVINEVPRANMEHVREVVGPYLKRHGLQLLGVLPKDQLLAAPTVAELAEGLQAEILCAPEHTGKLVEHMLVGAMSVESALTYFRRKPNKAVITGGDRADIQLAALETSTRSLVLTGNLYPNPVVLNRAEELGVPVLLTSLDTLSAVEIIERYFDRSRFQQPQKIERFTALLNEHFDFASLYEALGISPRQGNK